MYDRSAYRTRGAAGRRDCAQTEECGEQSRDEGYQSKTPRSECSPERVQELQTSPPIDCICP
eukprot:5005243-Prymnesium_polylepis.2